MGLEAEGKKMVTPAKHEAGKGFMKGPSITQEKPPILLYEDSKYALEKLLSIITFENYENLSNHATEAMRETRLLCIARVSHAVHFLSFPSTNHLCFQAMVMMKGLMGRCLNHETALDHVRVKANETEDELNGLKA